MHELLIHVLYELIVDVLFFVCGNTISLINHVIKLDLSNFPDSHAPLSLKPEVAVFGASMAGACVGFLLHNRYKASVCMGNTGSLALAGALAAMASCSGMFCPLFIASGIIVLEVFAMAVQVYILVTSK